MPPNTPVYSYHCTAHISFEKPWPSSSQGKDVTSAELYRFSLAIHSATSRVYAKARGARFDTKWKVMKATKFHHVPKVAAAIGPMGVAFHTHHTVAACQSRHVSTTHPAIRHQSAADAEYVSLIISRGMRATSSDMPLKPSQPNDSSRAEHRTSAKRFFVVSCVIDN